MVNQPRPRGLDPNGVSTYRAHMATQPAHPPVEVGVREARANFSRYLREARAGTPVVITSRGEPDVELRLRAEPVPKPREPGFLIGTELEHFELPEWT